METYEIAKAYDRLAQFWAGKEFNRENGITQHKQALRFSERKRKAIDVGCGSSGRFIEMLIGEGFHVEALDISEEMVRLSKERHPEVVYHLEDVCVVELSEKYDFITAWDSIWHVPLKDQEQVFKKLLSALEEKGVMIFSCGGTDKEGERTNPCMGQPLYHATLGIPKIQQIVIEMNCICRHLEFDQWPLEHAYLIVQKAEQVDGSDVDR